MKLKCFRIVNYRCCSDITLDVGAMHAIVGANNAGKSTILRALDLFFNPSSSKVNEESFLGKQTDLAIRLEALFDALTPDEIEQNRPYLKPDNTFHIARTVRAKSSEESDEEQEGQFTIGQEYNSPRPKQEWLRADQISGANIKQWLKDEGSLRANDVSFIEFLEGDTKVGTWKSKATEFIESHLPDADIEDAWTRNPKGFPSVLKAALPHFELIPAVRDVADESKVLKTNPFGRLINRIVTSLDATLRENLSTQLEGTVKRLNRVGGSERLKGVSDAEKDLNKYLGEMMDADLELEFQAPTVETLLTTPKLLIDDGFRGSVDGKGHGLQRSVIFAILRSYAALATAREERKKTLILAVEEPELYMHPTAQRTIRKVFRAISNAGDQVLFTTHSPLLVDVAYFDEIVRMEASRPIKEKGKKTVYPGNRVFQLPMQNMIEDLEARHSSARGKVTEESMRERYGHAYTPSRNEGFFAKKILLVEGATELYCLPIYARAMGHDFDLKGIAVIECGGKDQIDRLYRIFNELGIPCYVLFDYDKSNADGNVAGASKNILKFLDDSNDDAPEAAVVTSTHAYFAEKWEVDLRNEIPDVDSLTGDATRFLGPSGKPLVARFIANKLTEVEKPHVPKTIAQIVEKAIAVTHSGTCLALPQQE